MSATYKKLEELFKARTDALCEDKLPQECDCTKCPCQLLCSVLCSCDPAEEVPEVWLKQFVL